MGKSRVPMQVSPKFEEKVKRIQKEIMKKQGEKMSLRDITEHIEKIIDLDRLEKIIMNNANLDIKVTLDRRGK